MSLKRPRDSIESPSEVEQPEPKQPKVMASAGTKQLAEDLYNYCNNSFTSDDTIRKEDLLESNIFPDKKLETMRPIIQYLVDRKLFKMWRDPERGITWKLVDRAQAAKHSQLSNNEERLIYSCIESAGIEGIWSASIKNKTGIPQTKVPKTLKALESRGLIKFFKSPDRPNARMCILKDLEPVSIGARGAFYKDGELDEELVHIVGTMVLNYIAKQSFIAEPIDTSTTISKKGKEKMTKEEAETLRDNVLNEPPSDNHPHSRERSETKEPHKHHLKHKIKEDSRHFRYRHYPPGYNGFPTLEDVTEEINNSSAIKIVLPKVDIERLLNVLVWDERLQKINGSHLRDASPSDKVGEAEEQLPPKIMYRTFKNIKEMPAWNNGKEPDEGPGNGLTQIPCGRCPIIDLCGDDGVVNARNCKYWDQWMEQLDKQLDQQLDW